MVATSGEHSAYRQLSRKMATGYASPLPAPLEIHDADAAAKWKKFQFPRQNYALATEGIKKAEAMPVATRLTVIGEEAREVYSTFNDWREAMT